MSGVSSSAMALAQYSSITKNEQAQVTRYVNSSATTQATVSSFETSAATLGSSAAILANYKALQVLTGAYGMSGQINSTAILSDLMTQSADSTTSLVQKTANADYLHFARATQARATQTAALGSSGTISLTTGGNAASSVTMQNAAWSSGSTPTVKAPAVRWSFVLNDGSAADSVAAALNAASDGTSGGGYSVSATGVVTGPSGEASVTTATDAGGNTVYTLPIERDDNGTLIKSVQVVSVAVTAGTGPGAATAQLGALSTAMTNAGFNATLSSTNQLAVLNPSTKGTTTLADSFGTAIAVATASTLTPSGQLALGSAGKCLCAGQILTDGDTVIGTVKSVDSVGTVTLTAAAATTIDAGDTIQVATGLLFANMGTRFTTTTGAAAGATTLALGSAGASLKAGQVLISGGVAIGTVASVDTNGTVTLQAATTGAVAAGAALIASPAISGAPTAALSDARNVASIVSGFETNRYEASMGDQYAGLDDALYYSRSIGSITSIAGLMSNSRLLSVVTTSLGMGSYFGELDYARQVSLLTDKVKLTELTSAAGIRQTSLQYLIARAADTVVTDTGIASLFSSASLSSTDMLGLANGIMPGSSTTTTTTDPVLSLFT